MSPDVYAIDVLEHFKLDRIFGIITGGTSGSKEENILAICKEWNCQPNEIIFVGDGDTDLNCAIALHLVFVGIINQDNDYAQREDITYKDTSLESFMSLLKQIQDTDEPQRMGV